MFEIELESIAVRNIRVSTGSRFYFQSQILNVHGLLHLQAVNLKRTSCTIFANRHEYKKSNNFSPNQEDRSWGQEQMSLPLHRQSLVGILVERDSKNVINTSDSGRNFLFSN